MAPNLRVFCLLLLCASIVVNVDTKFFGNSKKTTTSKQPVRQTSKQASTTHHHTTKAPYRPHVRETIPKPERYTVDHATQRNSYTGAGYPSRTQPPKTVTQQKHVYPATTTSAPYVKHQYNPVFQAQVTKPPASQPASYPPSNGKLSGGVNTPTQPPSVQAPSYPSSQGSLSGGGYNPSSHIPAPQASVYPPSHGKLSGGLNSPNQSPSTQAPLYPSSHGTLSGGGGGASIHSPAVQAPSYPSNYGKLSGSGTNGSSQSPTSQSASYPPNNGKLSGTGFNNYVQPPAVQPSVYPSNNAILSGSSNYQQSVPPATGSSNWTAHGNKTYFPSPGSTGVHTYPHSTGQSGNGHKPNQNPPMVPNQLQIPSSGSTVAHTYPNSYGQSGGGHKPNQYPQMVPNQPQIPSLGSTGVHTYPNSYGQSGSGHKPIQNPQIVAGSQGYVDHIYVRNRYTTNIYNNNMQPTHYQYHYRPPSRIYYTTSNGQQHHYPVYKEDLPGYVYEYSSSRSRFSTLLAGLALYNLGHVSKEHAAHLYHNQYRPKPFEICRFGVKYNEFTREEVDIDCRLMTDFIWSLQNVKKTPMVPNIKQILLPNGTLVQPESVQLDGYQVLDALDPRFNGAPLEIKPGMKCYMKYFDGYYVATEKYVSCGVLQTYVKKSFNLASKITPTLLVFAATVVLAMLN